ncbi:MAG: hypothetical protein HC803_00565 [Saprospiraceae bacterium]|nr:hypothetical protein [Saprospiraceae bacterium]
MGWKIILIIILVIMVSGGMVGIMYYFRKFRDLLSETKDLLAAIFVALKDGKLTAEEKENIINEAMDMSPIAKDIGRQFFADAKAAPGKITKKVKDLTGK